MAHGGEAAGIAASFTWAVGSLIFSRVPVPAGALNLFKCCLAAALFGLTLAVLAALRGDSFLHATSPTLLLLSLSALVGIVVGDTAFYRSLQILGARRALVLATLAPVVAAVLGRLVLEEKLTAQAWAGMGITLAGVAWVLLERGAQLEAAGHYPGSIRAGVACGVAAAACQAAGMLLSKQGMKEVDALEASFVRLATAALLGLAWAVASSRLAGWRGKLFTPGLPSRLILATACGTYLGIWLSLIACRHAPIAVATTLTSLTPIFILPLGRVFLGHRMSPRGILGAILAVAGVGLLVI